MVKDKKVSLKFYVMKSARASQNAPSCNRAMNIMKDGKVIADHYISSRRFENILKKQKNIFQS